MANNNDTFPDTLLALAERTGDALKARNLTICAAESCTGGLFLSSLTDISGSSAYVLGGVVTYSNAAKEQFVGVQHQTLIDHGAVSAETACEMAEGVRRVFGADVGVGITGIAGPGGGTPEKPVGLVFISVAINGATHVERCEWRGGRIHNKRLSVEEAFRIILRIVAQ